MQLMTMDDTDFLANVMTSRAPTLIRLSDEQGVYRFFNDTWAAFTGRSSDEERGNGWLRSVHVDDRTAVAASYRDAIAAQADVDIQFRLLRRDGVYRWMLDRASPWRQADGSFGGLVSACMDVTTLKLPPAGFSQDPRAMRLQSALLKMGHDNRVVFVSPGIEALLGFPASDVIGKTLAEANLPQAVSDALHAVTERNASEEAGQGTKEVEFTFPGAEHELHLAVSAIADATGDLLIVIHDITASVSAEALQREEISRHKAEAAARSRDQFLSVVSHELRSPLNGIQSWAHVLESQIDTSRPIVARALAGIKTGVTQQVALIEALLDATQILNGHLSLLPQAYSLNGAIQAALDGMQADAAQKEIEITFTPDFSDMDMVGDAERIQQVIRHLLSNAIKFTPDGGNVRIGVTREGDGAGAMAVISVQDNGSGIAPGFAFALFEPFRQVDSSQTRRAAGLGLGLAVSKRITELHGGSLKCESEGVGHGSTFRVYLPLSR